MSEEKTQDWNKKRILMTVVGVMILAVVLVLADNVLITIGAIILGGVTAATQDTIKQIIKDLFAPFLKSDTASDNPTLPAKKPTIHFGHHAQVGQIGDHNTQHNNIQIIHQGVTNIDLAKQLGITETALQNFFKILEHQNVPAAELDNALRKLAARHKELKDRVRQLTLKIPRLSPYRNRRGRPSPMPNMNRPRICWIKPLHWIIRLPRKSMPFI